MTDAMTESICRDISKTCNKIIKRQNSILGLTMECLSLLGYDDVMRDMIGSKMMKVNQTKNSCFLKERSSQKRF